MEIRWLKRIIIGALFGLLLAVSPVSLTLADWVVSPPSGLTLTYISDYEIGISWTKGELAANTMVRARYGSAPTSRTNGYLVYYGDGTSANDTGVSIEDTGTGIYYRAWSQNAAGVWEDEGIINWYEGIGLTLIGTGLTLMGQGLMLIVALLPLVLFSVLSFWRPNPVLFMLSAGVSVMTGFYYYDTYVTNLGLTLGLCLLAFSLFCLGMAYRTLFWKRPRE